MAAPIGADQSPSHLGLPVEDSDGETGTAASLDLIIVRLQTLEAADQVRNASDLPVVVNVRSGGVHRVVGDPSNPTDWQTRCGFHNGGLKPHVRFADSRESPVDCGICLCGSSHAPPNQSSQSCAGAFGGSFTGASCTAPVTLLAKNKKEGWEGGTTGGPLVVKGIRRVAEVHLRPAHEEVGTSE